MSDTTMFTKKPWSGTSMDDIYYGHGPWNFETLPIYVSKDHKVLYHVPATLKSAPKPHISCHVYHWDDDHVRMPYSSKNLFPAKNADGEEILTKRWDLIQTALLRPITCTAELESAIDSYNTRMPQFLAMHNFFTEVLEEEESLAFFENILPGIIRLGLRLPEILPGSIPLLKQGISKSISLSQLQIASLLANAFLCTFPWRKDSEALYPGVNFMRLFAAYWRPKRRHCVIEKLKCIIHYFRRILSTEPVGVVTFKRKYLARKQLPGWDYVKNNLANTRIHITSSGVIEDAHGLLQVDFANKNVGGGVLSFGGVQEEIRFIICPELIVSRLFTEQLGATEALLMTGIERYSEYTGYGDTFTWAGNYNDTTPYDNSGRRLTSVIAIDALRFIKPIEQYQPSCIRRELNKAFVGFHSRFEGQLSAVATGNWGCGAFKGDAHLKFLLQLMACSAARRDMVYYTFGDDELRNNIYEMHLFLSQNQITIEQLWKYLCQFAAANLKPSHLYSYIHQVHLDNKKQPSIRGFVVTKRKNIESDNNPSTSNHNCSKENNTSTKSEFLSVNKIVSEKRSKEDVDMESDLDIFELFHPDEPLSTTNKQQSFTKNVQRESENCQDIIQLIDLIDGKATKAANDKSPENVSLLLAIDKCTRIPKRDEPCIVEKMDVEETITSTNTQSNKNNHVLSKGKITNYFFKIDKG